MEQTNGAAADPPAGVADHSAAASATLKRSRKMTQFEPPQLADLNFYVDKSDVPIDGLAAIHSEAGRAGYSDLCVPRHVDEDEVPEDVFQETITGDDYKTITRVPINDTELIYTHFLQLSQCYRAMANNNKIVVFDDNMDVRKAFNALIYNSTRTGLVYDSRVGYINGVLSVSDYIMVLMERWNLTQGACSSIPDIDETTIREWKDLLKRQTRSKEFKHITINESLYRAVELMYSSRIHRLPVMDPASGQCMFILTYRRLLNYVVSTCRHLPQPSYLMESVRALGVGAWKDIKYVRLSTPLFSALDTLVSGKVSGLPVVEDDSMKVVDVYTHFDAISVAFSRKLDLSISMQEALHMRGARTRGVSTIGEHCSLSQVLRALLLSNLHRIFAVDDQGRLKGVISLTDITRYMLIRPSQLHQKLATLKI